MSSETRSAPIFGDHLPITVLERREGRFLFDITFNDYHVNAAGGVHGGVVLSVLDIAIAGGGSGSDDENAHKYGITLNITCNFLKPVPTGTLRCEGVVVGGGRSTKFVEARLSGADGTLYASASGAVRAIDLPRTDG